MSNELHLPEAAYSAYLDAESVRRREGDNGTAYAYGLRAATKLVVAAELRRLAALLDETDDARKLLARADELDGGAAK